ncbi:MAG: LysM peptidoglycan-binding domain-containing protein [Nitrospirota bacterium]|jgi:hypothetical protein
MGRLIRDFIAVAALVLLVASTAGAEEFQYEEYTVIRGDTLWDITYDKLEDPFNWPIVWRENSWIKDPDLIYPGQKLRIPVDLLKQPEVTIAREEAPAPAPPPPPAEKAPEPRRLEIRRDALEITADDILRGGYIAWEVPHEGEIVGSPGRRIVLGNDDEVYITGAEAPRVGDRYYILRGTNEVEHPEDYSDMGTLVRVRGILEVTRVGERDVTARIERTFDSVTIGDRLERFYTVPSVILTGEARQPDVEGLVVASANMRVLSGMLQFVYINKGKNDGLMPGDMIATLAPGTPDRANGVLRVISTRDETATLIVEKSLFDVSIGDKVAPCSKVEGCIQM